MYQVVTWRLLTSLQHHDAASVASTLNVMFPLGMTQKTCDFEKKNKRKKNKIK